MELSHIKTDHSYCQAPTRNFECGGRLRVQKCEGLKWIYVEQGNLPKALLKPRQTRDTSLCIESVNTTQKLYLEKKQTHSAWGGMHFKQVCPKVWTALSPNSVWLAGPVQKTKRRKKPWSCNLTGWKSTNNHFIIHVSKRLAISLKQSLIPNWDIETPQS